MQKDFKGVWIPREIWCLSDLNISEKIVLSVANTLSEQDDGCFANNEYFAKLLNLSKGRISKIINLLVKKGYLTTDFSYHSEIRKVEKRKIKVCIEGGCLGPQNADFKVINNQGYSHKQPYPLVANDQDIKYIYKINYNNSSSQLSETEKNQKIEKLKVDDEAIKSTKKFESDSKPYKLALYLEDCIRFNEPKFPQSEQQRQRWAKDIDRMLRIDKIDPDEAAAVIAWSQKDSFWRSNILSGKKLREKYPQLLMKMNQKQR